MLNMKNRRLRDKGAGIFLILCMLLAGLGTPPAMAYAAAPDYWFVETVRLDSSELPSDFHVFNGEANPEQVGEGIWLTTNNPAESSRAAIYLINHSNLPIYVMSLEYRDRLVMATPDENYEARVRVAHEAASYLVRPDSGEVFELNWEALMDLDASLTDLNQATAQPPPADITPPAALQSELLLVYGDQVVLLPFSIHYSVNQNFEGDEVSPTSAAEITAVPLDEGVPGAGAKVLLVTAGTGLSVLIGWLVWRWRKRQ
jgi:hypothetical protein